MRREKLVQKNRPVAVAWGREELVVAGRDAFFSCHCFGLSCALAQAMLSNGASLVRVWLTMAYFDG